MQDLQDQRPIELMVSVAGREPHAAVAALESLYSGVGWYCRPMDEQFWFKYVAVGDDQLSFRRSQMHGFLSGTASTGDDIVIQWLEGGRGRVVVGGSEVHVQSSTMPTLLPEVQQFRFEYEDWDQRLVHLRRDLLLDVAAEHGGVNVPSTFDTSVTPDADALGSGTSRFGAQSEPSEATVASPPLGGPRAATLLEPCCTSTHCAKTTRQGEGQVIVSLQPSATCTLMRRNRSLSSISQVRRA